MRHVAMTTATAPRGPPPGAAWNNVALTRLEVDLRPDFLVSIEPNRGGGYEAKSHSVHYSRLRALFSTGARRHLCFFAAGACMAACMTTEAWHHMHCGTAETFLLPVSLSMSNMCYTEKVCWLGRMG